MISDEREDYVVAERLGHQAVALAGRDQLSEHWITIMRAGAG